MQFTIHTSPIDKTAICMQPPIGGTRSKRAVERNLPGTSTARCGAQSPDIHAVERCRVPCCEVLSAFSLAANGVCWDLGGGLLLAKGCSCLVEFDRISENLRSAELHLQHPSTPLKPKALAQHIYFHSSSSELVPAPRQPARTQPSGLHPEQHPANNGKRGNPTAGTHPGSSKSPSESPSESPNLAAPPHCAQTQP
ncbi:hypothetical protein P154DRAFT_578705 [Amniculicola lignicola CBS 123094]|uniref:Uncharacterized protein n=1 Tax=Amniculicola lignicola CBS 123094 TaxID=1392246 RepID=A0A6A5WIU8_9PLEO|nr:hypothetical protein P154DRAFT_578705 [Amniculicola lignicola CBS 123094]